MKRILGVLISSVILAVSCLTAMPVSAKEEYTEYIVPFYSDQTKQRQVLGISNESMLKDGVVLIPLETACEIAGASIAAEDDDAVIITRNYVSWCCEYEDTDKQYLLVDSNTGEGDYFEAALDNLSGISSKGIFGVWNPFDYSVEYDGFHVAFTIDDFHQTKIPCKFHDDKLYVSFYDFLVMMGVDVDLINHEAINEITEFYTSMVEQYSTEEDYKTAVSEIDKLFSAGTGYEQFFYCTLGTPIDELYKAYYDSDLMCDLGDYYGDGSVEWANLVNAVENYDGLTKTALAALNLNTDYEDVLINTVTYHGDSEDDNFSKTVDDSVDIIQRLLYVRDFGLSVEEIYRDDSVLETVWRMQEKADNIEPILSSVDDFEVDFSLSPDAISLVYSGLCGAMKNYAKYREMSNLFEGEQYLMKNTILSSDAMASNTTDEARGMFISHILNPMGNVIEIHSNLRNEENSYFNLYRSAAKVQETMNKSSPAAWAAVWGAIDNAVADYVDGLILDAIDLTFFGGMPVSSLVNSGILFCVDGLKNTAYGKEQSRIAELDDYVFLQEVAKDCFKEHSPDSENAHSSFILGLKATMLAFESTNAGSSGEIHGGGGRSFDSNENSERKGYVPEELYGLLDQSVAANVDFYNVFPDDCDDLTEMIGNNTDISMLDTPSDQYSTPKSSENNTENENIEVVEEKLIDGVYVRIDGHMSEIHDIYRQDVDAGVGVAQEEAFINDRNGGEPLVIENGRFTLWQFASGAYYGDCTVKNGKMYFTYDTYRPILYNVEERLSYFDETSEEGVVRIDDDIDSLEGEEARNAQWLISRFNEWNSSGTYRDICQSEVSTLDRYLNCCMYPEFNMRSDRIRSDNEYVFLEPHGDFLCTETYGFKLNGSYDHGEPFEITYNPYDAFLDDAYSPYYLDEWDEDKLNSFLGYRYECYGQTQVDIGRDTTLYFENGIWEWYNSDGGLIHSGAYQESEDYPGLIMMTITDDSPFYVSEEEYNNRDNITDNVEKSNLISRYNSWRNYSSKMPLLFYIAQDGEIYYPGFVRSKYERLPQEGDELSDFEFEYIEVYTTEEGKIDYQLIDEYS